jgi:uncharacterized membrane protein YqaE (UPF0057 family)
MNILDIILALIFPPLPVALKYGIGKIFWINLVLTLLFFIPGFIHALFVLAKK